MQTFVTRQMVCRLYLNPATYSYFLKAWIYHNLQTLFFVNPQVPPFPTPLFGKITRSSLYLSLLGCTYLRVVYHPSCPSLLSMVHVSNSYLFWIIQIVILPLPAGYLEQIWTIKNTFRWLGSCTTLLWCISCTTGSPDSGLDMLLRVICFIPCGICFSVFGC